MEAESAFKPITASEWYRFLTSTQDRLNLLLRSLDEDLIRTLFGTLYPCRDISSIDAIDINGLPFTNLASVLNGFLGYSDSHGRTFRLSAVYDNNDPKEYLLKGFVVTVSSTKNDDTFPIFPD